MGFQENNIINRHLRPIKYVLFFFAVVLLVYLLKTLSTLLIPLVLAFFITLLLYPLIDWVMKKKIPYIPSVMLVLLFISFITYLVVQQLVYSVSTLTENQEELTQQIMVKIQPAIDFVGQYVQADFKTVYEKFIPYALENLPTNFVFELAGNTFFMLLYLIFFLSGNILKMDGVIEKIISNPEKSKVWVNAFQEIRDSLTKYVIVKSVVSFMTGFGYVLACWFFGVKFAILWGFLAFLLNFIPNVGSLIATIPVILLAWVQIDSSSSLIIFIVLLIAVQQIMGNVVEPIWMGKSFSLNTIFVLFGLVLCTFVWGIIGAVLAVPILVLVKKLLEHIPGTGFFVRLMESHSTDK